MIYQFILKYIESHQFKKTPQDIAVWVVWILLGPGEETGGACHIPVWRATRPTVLASLGTADRQIDIIQIFPLSFSVPSPTLYSLGHSRNQGMSYYSCVLTLQISLSNIVSSQDKSVSLVSNSAHPSQWCLQSRSPQVDNWPRRLYPRLTVARWSWCCCCCWARVWISVVSLPWAPAHAPPSHVRITRMSTKLNGNITIWQALTHVTHGTSIPSFLLLHNNISIYWFGVYWQLSNDVVTVRQQTSVIRRHKWKVTLACHDWTKPRSLRSSWLS